MLYGQQIHKPSFNSVKCRNFRRPDRSLFFETPLGLIGTSALQSRVSTAIDTKSTA